MKKIMNSPSDFVKETIEGILLAYPDKLKIRKRTTELFSQNIPIRKEK